MQKSQFLLFWLNSIQFHPQTKEATSIPELCWKP